MLENRQLFFRHLAQTSESPMAIALDRAEGIYLYDSDNVDYVDLIAGFAVSNIGHSHPQVITAIKDQIDRYMHLMVYGEIIQQPQVQYAQKLTSLLPENLNTVYFTSSGTEATEGAMKLAKRHTNRSKIIYFKNSYHGSTQGALSIMGDEYFKQAYRPLLPDVHALEYGNINELNKVDQHTAAVFFEPIQAESGVTVPSFDFAKALEKRCHEMGALLVIDEAQTAFGRTGKLWGFEHFGIQPDIILLAKAIGGGLPLGAFIANQSVMKSLTTDPVLGHITTFGGHPVSCAAGLAALQVLLDENLIVNVEAKGLLFEQLLTHPKVKQIRRKGLMMALDFEQEDLNKKIIHRAVAKKIFTDWFLFSPTSLRICPPLTITEEQVYAVCKTLKSCIDEVE